MTTNQQIPYNRYEGNGTKTSYAFTYDLIEPSDLYVMIDGVLMVEYSDYTVDPDYEDGSNVTFTLPPADGADILIYRKTDITQNVDYESFSSFPADTHEWNLDKITKILQELIQGVIDGVGGDGGSFTLTFDLDAVQGDITVTITNTGGTDAVIPMWTNAEYAGVYAGKVDLEANLPADESPTTEPDGYVWLGY